MPQITPMPLGGLASVIDANTDRQLDIETNRFGVGADFGVGTPTYTATSDTLTNPSGFPVLTLTVGFSGNALVFGSVETPANKVGIAGVNVDGSATVYLVNTFGVQVGFLSGSPTRQLSGFVLFTGLSLGTHTFDMYVANMNTATYGDTAFSLPALSGWPI